MLKICIYRIEIKPKNCTTVKLNGQPARIVINSRFFIVSLYINTVDAEIFLKEVARLKNWRCYQNQIRNVENPTFFFIELNLFFKVTDIGGININKKLPNC